MLIKIFAKHSILNVNVNWKEIIRWGFSFTNKLNQSYPCIYLGKYKPAVNKKQDEELTNLESWNE